MLEATVDIWIVGNAGPPDEYNPFRVIEVGPAAQILYHLNRGVRTVSELTEKLSLPSEEVHSSLNDMARIEAVHQEREYWQIDQVLSLQGQTVEHPKHEHLPKPGEQGVEQGASGHIEHHPLGSHAHHDPEEPQHQAIADALDDA